jgi:cbb3-type cytochrome oxidase subunit 3
MLQSTAAYLVQYGAAMSTATAIIRDREIEATAAVAAGRRARSWRTLGLVFGWGVMLLALVFMAMLIHILWLRGKAQAEILRSRAAILSGSPSPPAQLPPSLPPDNSPDGTIQFLYQAAQVVGGDAVCIPSDDKMGWSPRPWTRETKRLVAAGALYVQPGRGSYIKLPYRNITGLYTAVTTRRLALPPYPAGDGRINNAWNGNGNGNGGDNGTD